MPEDPPTDENASKAKTSYDLIVLASSAGGIEPLLLILSGLPHDFPAALIAVQHLRPDHKSHLTAIAARRTALKVKQAEDGDRMSPGWVYIAPPDYHLLVKRGEGWLYRMGNAEIMCVPQLISCLNQQPMGGDKYVDL